MAEVRPATILIIGDELLAGEIADKNGPHFAEQLTGLGWRVRAIHVLPDDTDVIAAAVRDRLAHDLVLVCGGLGPTSDDRTTEAVSQALGRPLEHHEEVWQHIRAIFGVRDVEPPPGNEKQALIPEGATLLPNLMGTAPGFFARQGDGAVAVLPGPPRENRPLFENALVPLLEELHPEAPRVETRVFRVFGLPESTVGDRLRDVEARYPQVRVGYQARFPEILVKVRHDSATRAVGDEVAAALYEVLSPHLYHEGDTRLPEVLGRALAERDLRVVTAESCTAGLTAKLLTDVSGSSAWMERGFVTYTNESKTEVLGVDPALLAEHGAVSEPVALAMLAGSLERSPADVGVAITGVAGPTGGTDDKPVGTVCIAWGDRETPRARTSRFPFNREFNRLLSAWAALGRLHRFVSSQQISPD